MEASLRESDQKFRAESTGLVFDEKDPKSQTNINMSDSSSLDREIQKKERGKTFK
jgi:hypothetical protein